MSPSSSKKGQTFPQDTRTNSENAASSPTGAPSSSTLARAAVPQGSTSGRPLPFRPKTPVRASPLLSKRQMEDLLRGNRDNRVSVRIGNESICTILKPVAKHFSRTWRRELGNIHCNTVNVAMPSADAQATPAGNSPGLSYDEQTPGLAKPTTTPADKNAVTFIVQWMERGGADPTGKHALLYPRGNKEELERLRDLVTALEIAPLITRTKRDLAAIRPKYCTLCKTTGHLRPTCVFCVYCKERTHMRDDCPRLQVKAERELARIEWQERQDRYRAQREERAQRSLQQGIRAGRVGVGNDGKTIWL